MIQKPKLKIKHFHLKVVKKREESLHRRVYNWRVPVKNRSEVFKKQDKSIIYRYSVCLLEYNNYSPTYQYSKAKSSTIRQSKENIIVEQPQQYQARSFREKFSLGQFNLNRLQNREILAKGLVAENFPAASCLPCNVSRYTQ